MSGQAIGASAGAAPGRLPAYHPSEATLAAYAAGGLARPPALVVAAHLATCPACRRDVRIAEAVGGLLLDELPPAGLADDALARTLSRLDAPAPRATGTAAAPAGATGSGPHAGARRADPASRPALPAALRGLPVGRYRWVAPGVHWAGILRSEEGTLGLLRVKSGIALPLHTHSGTEMTLVLEGAYDGQPGGLPGRLLPGDVEEADEDVDHDQVAVGPGDCVCLVATTGRLRFRTPLSRLWQPFMPF